MGNGYCLCNSNPGGVAVSKCEYKMDIPDNSLLLNDNFNNNNNVNNKSKNIDSINNNNEFSDKIFPCGDNITNLFVKKEKGIEHNNLHNVNNDSNNNEKIKEEMEEEKEEKEKKEENEQNEQNVNKSNFSKSENVEKGNEEIIKIFENFIKDYAKLIDDEIFENATNSKVKEIEDKLEVIEEVFESEIHNL